MTDVPETVPTPLLMLVELAFDTFHERTELWPAMIDVGVAINEGIVGAGHATVALQVVVATVEDASVACRVIEYVPGDTASVCIAVVEPFPQRNATGFTPPDELALHVMFVAVGDPLHVAVSAEAAPANENVSNIPAVATDKTLFRTIYVYIMHTLVNMRISVYRSYYNK